MSQKLPVNGFKWAENISQFNENFIKSYNEESDEEYFFEADVQYREKLHDLHNDLPFFLGRMKIEKVGKFVANFHDKKEYFIHIKNSKQALNHGLVSKRVYRFIKFSQKAWLKPCINMNTELRKMQKFILKKIFLSWWIIQFLEKLWKQ